MSGQDNLCQAEFLLCSLGSMEHRNHPKTNSSALSPVFSLAEHRARQVWEERQGEALRLSWNRKAIEQGAPDVEAAVRALEEG